MADKYQCMITWDEDPVVYNQIKAIMEEKVIPQNIVGFDIGETSLFIVHYMREWIIEIISNIAKIKDGMLLKDTDETSEGCEKRYFYSHNGEWKRVVKVNTGFHALCNIYTTIQEWAVEEKDEKERERVLRLLSSIRVIPDEKDNIGIWAMRYEGIRESNPSED